MALLDILIFALGLGLLIGGAWVLITGGTRVAAVLGLPPVVIGLTVVAFGTSAPELFVSVLGAMKGSTGLVLGNVIGSNVANLGLILGLAALLRPVTLEKVLLRTELPFMLVVSLVFAALAWDGSLSRPEGGILLAGFALFMGWTVLNRDRGAVVPLPPEVKISPERRGRELTVGSLQVVAGVAALAGGGQLLVDSAVRIALQFGVSETVIGLTLVAVGTSLPELATTIVAAFRRESDMAVGNIIGSNVFNILAVAGPVGLVWPLNVDGPQLPLGHLLLRPTPNQLQLASMGLLTLVVLVLALAGRGRLNRPAGGGLLALYILTMILWTN